MVNRAQQLAERFKIGAQVRTPSCLPMLKNKEWLVIHPEMVQFFCGEKLEIIGAGAGPDNKEWGVLLNTRSKGASTNYWFNADWLTIAADVDEMPIQLVPNKKAAASSKRLEKFRAGIQLVQEEQPVPAAKQNVEREAPKTAKQSLETGWGATIGGALAAGLGLALFKKKFAKTEKQEFFQPVLVDESEVHEVPNCEEVSASK